MHQLITAQRQVSAARTALACTRTVLTRLDRRMLDAEAASAKAHGATDPAQMAGAVAQLRQELQTVGRQAQQILPDARMIGDQLDRASSTLVRARAAVQQLPGADDLGSARELGWLQGRLEGLAGALEVSAPTASAVARHVHAAAQQAVAPSLEGTQDAFRAGQFVVGTQEALPRADSAARSLEESLERAGSGLRVAAAAATRRRDRGARSVSAATDQEPRPPAPPTAGAAAEKRTPPGAAGASRGHAPSR